MLASGLRHDLRQKLPFPRDSWAVSTAAVLCMSTGGSFPTTACEVPFFPFPCWCRQRVWSVSLLLFAIKIELSWFRGKACQQPWFYFKPFCPSLCPSNPLFLPFPTVLITPDIISGVIEENRLAIMRIKEISSQGPVPLTCGCTPRCALFSGAGSEGSCATVYCLWGLCSVSSQSPAEHREIARRSLCLSTACPPNSSYNQSI